MRRFCWPGARVARSRQAPQEFGAAQILIEQDQCSLILSDDGLQHYHLGRDVEIAVIDGERRHGNGRCLPAGPLREPLSRLGEVDLRISTGSAEAGEFAMRLSPCAPINLLDVELSRPLSSFDDEQVHAVCGIGNPERFFATLRASGLTLISHAFPDHHAYCAADFRFEDNRPVLMTEKDAVKCAGFATQAMWYVPVRVELPSEFLRQLVDRLPTAAPTAAASHRSGGSV